MNSIENYHALPSLSSSKVRTLLTAGPRVYESLYIARTSTIEPSDDMELGTAAQAVLSGVGSVLEIPAEVLSSSGSKAGAKWKQFAEENAGKTLMKSHEMARVNRIVAAVRNHPLAGKLYGAPGEAEKVIHWKDSITDTPCRAMLDWTCEYRSRKWIADLKVSSARCPREWRSRAEDHFYHVQQEWYRWGYDECFGTIPLFVFVVVANKPPHVCRVYQFGAEEVAAAREQMRGAIDEIVLRTGLNDWSDPGEYEVTEISLSQWAKEVKYGQRHDDHDDTGLGGECAVSAADAD